MINDNNESKADYYIQINDNGIADIIKGNAQEMLKQYGEISPSELANDLTDINLYNVYDKDNNLIKSNINSVRKGKDYWENFTDEYIKELKERLKQDLTGISQEDLTKLIIYHNNQFLNAYMFHIQRSALDLADEGVRFNYAKRLTNALIEIQLQEIQKYGIENFLKADINNLSSDFIPYISKESLKTLQSEVNDEIDDYISYMKADAKFSKISKSKDEIIYDFISIKLGTILLYEQVERAEKVYQNDKEFFDKRHKKRETINQLLKDISKKYQKIQDILTPNNDTTTKDTTKTNNDIVIRTMQDMIMSSVSDKRFYLKSPKEYIYDFDVLELFSNVFPNDKYKDINDRHNPHKIEARISLDIADTDDTIRNFENMRLFSFLRDNKISLYPVQSAIISAFIQIRDNQGSMDSVIPLQSTLKVVSKNREYKKTTNKKDIELFRNYMLFFNRCKAHIIIRNRKTNEIEFAMENPIPLLENTLVYKNGDFGYIVGRSVINILKNEYDSIREKRNITTFQANKKYFKTKLPNSLAGYNLQESILPKIAQMINSYNKRGKYQSLINIEQLYSYQASYNKHFKPTKDDKNTVREMLNTYLDGLIKNGIIDKYEPIKKGKEINQYRITINKDAKL